MHLMRQHFDSTDAQSRSAPRMGEQDAVETLKQTYFQGYPESAICVQSSVDSRNSAIHSAYRISLRPSSLPEPRHPSLKVVGWLSGARSSFDDTYRTWLKVRQAVARPERLRWPNQPSTPGAPDRRGVDTIAARAEAPTKDATW